MHQDYVPLWLEGKSVVLPPRTARLAAVLLSLLVLCLLLISQRKVMLNSQKEQRSNLRSSWLWKGRRSLKPVGVFFVHVDTQQEPKEIPGTILPYA